MKTTIPSRLSDSRGRNIFISNLINRENIRKHQEANNFEMCLIPKFKICPFGLFRSYHFLGSTKKRLLFFANFWKQLPDAKSRFAEAARPRELKRLEKELQAQFDSTGGLEYTGTTSILFKGLSFRAYQHAKF